MHVMTKLKYSLTTWLWYKPEIAEVQNMSPLEKKVCPPIFVNTTIFHSSFLKYSSVGRIYIWNCFSFFLFLCTGNYPNKGWINLKLTLPLGCLHGEVKPISHWDPPIDGLLQAQHLPTRIILFLFFCIRLTAVSRMSRYCIRVWPRRFLCWPTPKSRALLVYLVMINPKLWIDLELR